MALPILVTALLLSEHARAFSPHIKSFRSPKASQHVVRLQSQADTATLLDYTNMALDDEATADKAFWSVVDAVNQAEEQNEPLPAEVPVMLHSIFEADLRHLLNRQDQIRTNVTCLQPDESTDEEGKARRMNYIFDDADIKNLPLTEGRKCEGGECTCACSRNIFPTFCGSDAASTDLQLFPELTGFTFNNLTSVSAATILQFVRLVERVRRSMAHEYGVPLSTLLPLQAYSRKYVAGTTQQGGGGGEGDFITMHCDEATHTGYHYSCVIYLSTHGKDFEGGAFVFNDAGEQDENAIKEEEDDEWEDEDVVLPSFNYTALTEKIRSGEYVPPEVDEDDDFFRDDDDDDAHVSLDYYEQTDDFDDDLSDEDLDSLKEELRRVGRELTPYYPERGAAVIFSSGWENLHEVEKITSGVRYAIPCFFTTCPVPDVAYEQMSVGKPQTNEMIADDWLHLLLAHREESPIQSVGRVKELLMKWHLMCTPLTEH